MSSRPEDTGACEGYERQVQRWVWDERGRLAAGERSATLSLAEAEAERADESACLLGEDPLTTEAISWTYDDAGRVATSTSEHADCEGTERVEERLRYVAGAVESTVDTGGSHSVDRFDVDECSRVVAKQPLEPAGAAIHFSYDERGRLVSETGSERRWNYAAGIVGDHDSSWTLEHDRARRTIYLSAAGTDDDRFVIALDERGRVIAVDSQHESWQLSYDDCPNSSLATTRWRVGEILSTWPFPRPPLAGEGAAELDRWLHAHLPLLPEAL